MKILLAIPRTESDAMFAKLEIDQRLARWLMMSQDRLGGDLVPLTQQFLAHMLGARRAGMTVAERVLQRAGMIACRRGRVTSVNHRKLEGNACECYEKMNRRSRTWQEESTWTLQMFLPIGSPITRVDLLLPSG